jgi:hypothetical protein
LSRGIQRQYNDFGKPLIVINSRGYIIRVIIIAIVLSIMQQGPDTKLLLRWRGSCGALNNKVNIICMNETSNKGACNAYQICKLNNKLMISVKILHKKKKKGLESM